MTRTAPLLAACAAAVLLASACTHDDPKPNYSSVSTTPTSSSPTPTSSPSPTGFPTTGPNVNPGEVAPTEPVSARTHDSAGAIAFVSYYFKTTDWVFATSNTSILDSFYATNCTTCVNARNYLDSLLAGTRHFTGGRIKIDEIQIVQNDGRQSADFAVTGVADVTAAQVVGADGKIVQSFPASQGFQLTDWVRFMDGRWQIVEERKV